MQVQALDRDHLMMIPRGLAAQRALEALHPIQNGTPHEMVAGVAVLFATLCSRVGLDPEEMHALGLKLLRDEDHHKQTNDALQSLRDFAGIRVKGDRDVSIG